MINKSSNTSKIKHLARSFGGRVVNETEEDLVDGSIYQTFRPVAILGKYCGVLPMTRLYNCGWMPQIMSTILFGFVLPAAAIAAEAFNMWLFARFLVNIGTSMEMRPDLGIMEGSFVMAFVCFVVEGLCCFYNVLCKASAIERLLRQVSKTEALVVTNQGKNKGQLHRAGIGYVFVWISAVNLATHSLFHLAFYTINHEATSFVYFVLPAIPNLLANIIAKMSFVCVMYSVSGFFDVLKDSAASHLRLEGVESESSWSYDELQEQRRSYVVIHKLGEMMSSVLSPSVFVVFIAKTLLNFDLIVIAVRLQSKKVHDQDVILLIYYLRLACVALVILILIELAILSFVAGNVEQKASSISSILCRLKLNSTNTSQQIINEMNLLVCTHNCLPFKFSASGYFVIKKSLFASLVGTTIMFVIAIVQMQ